MLVDKREVPLVLSYGEKDPLLDRLSLARAFSGVSITINVLTIVSIFIAYISTNLFLSLHFERYSMALGGESQSPLMLFLFTAPVYLIAFGLLGNAVSNFSHFSSLYKRLKGWDMNRLEREVCIKGLPIKEESVNNNLMWTGLTAMSVFLPMVASMIYVIDKENILGERISSGILTVGLIFGGILLAIGYGSVKNKIGKGNWVASKSLIIVLLSMASAPLLIEFARFLIN